MLILLKKYPLFQKGTLKIPAHSFLSSYLVRVGAYNSKKAMDEDKARLISKMDIKAIVRPDNEF
jgi:hypothetical protein